MMAVDVRSHASHQINAGNMTGKKGKAFTCLFVRYYDVMKGQPSFGH